MTFEEIMGSKEVNNSRYCKGGEKVKETGIIMSGNHPRLILDGLKTQTGRVIKPQPDRIVNGLPYRLLIEDGVGEVLKLIPCPYGGVGDRLWVKETWASENRYNHLKPSEIPQMAKIFYLAPGYNPFEMGKVRSPLFMPRWASRILLEITELGAQRLQDISYKDSKAEGYISISDFAIRWDSLNAKRGFGWERNPFVWVISFKRYRA
jgi:hypothetical protein